LLLSDYVFGAYLESRADAYAAEQQAAQEEADAEAAAQQAQAADAEAQADLAAAQAARDQAAADAAANAPATNTAQASVSDDVQAQLQTQVTDTVTAVNAGQNPDISQTIQDPKHIYAVNDSFTGDAVIDNDDNTYTCSLSNGDLIQLDQDNPPQSTDAFAYMKVVSSTQGDCAVNATVKVAMSRLQDMMNEYSAKVEEGMGLMKDNNVPGNSNVAGM
jgi:multidrug efflux pump subunit AcrA (membrane-fusion protein)